MNKRFEKEFFRERLFVRKGAFVSAFYSVVILISIGGAGFRLWPSTLIGLVGLGYMFSLIFAYAMSLFFYVHLEPSPILSNDALIEIGEAEPDAITPKPQPTASRKMGGFTPYTDSQEPAFTS